MELEHDGAVIRSSLAHSVALRKSCAATRAWRLDPLLHGLSVDQLGDASVWSRWAFESLLLLMTSCTIFRQIKPMRGAYGNPQLEMKKKPKTY